MTFARGAAVQGDWLLSGSLDKPPLSIYLSALSMIAVGNSADAAGVLQLDVYAGEFAGKLPNVVFALLFTALMMRLAWKRYRDWPSACLAGLLSAASPYLAAFGAAAFTDMSLLFFALSPSFRGRRRGPGPAWRWASHSGASSRPSSRYLPGAAAHRGASRSPRLAALLLAAGRCRCWRCPWLGWPPSPGQHLPASGGNKRAPDHVCWRRADAGFKRLAHLLARALWLPVATPHAC